MGHALFRLLFGFSGRINRAKWWLSVLATVFIFLLVLALVPPGEPAAPSDPWAIVLLILLIDILWITLAGGTKRLHDLNRSGAWLVVFVGVPILLNIILGAYLAVSLGTAIMAGQTPEEVDFMRFAGIAGIVNLIWLPIAIWALIWLGGLRGTVGPNQYGPDPLEGSL